MWPTKVESTVPATVRLTVNMGVLSVGGAPDVEAVIDLAVGAVGSSTVCWACPVSGLAPATLQAAVDRALSVFPVQTGLRFHRF